MSGVGCDYLMIPKKNMMYCTVVLKVGNVPSSSLIGRHHQYHHFTRL